MDEEVRLRIPAQPDMMLVARMTLWGYCSQRGADTPTLEDIRTLSDEACYCLMHQPIPAERLQIALSMDGPLCCVRFEALGEGVALSGRPAHDPEFARGILSSLAVSVDFTLAGDSVVAIRATLRLAP